MCIMEARIVDPYTTRYVSLGSGPRERASACGCNYRTKTPKKIGSCYTHLNSDPVLISHDRQQKGLAEKKEISPLVKQLNREPFQIPPGKGRLKRRPYSAMTQSQLDSYYEQSPFVNRLIAVKGQNISYQERPVARRISESSMIDQAIDSVQQATYAELSRLASSPLSRIEVPIPPCPSPEELVEDCEAESSNKLDRKVREFSDEVGITLESESAMTEKTDSGNSNVHEDITRASLNHIAHVDINDLGLEKDAEMMNYPTKTHSKRAVLAWGKKLEIAVPTGKESEISDTDEDFPAQVARKGEHFDETETVSSTGASRKKLPMSKNNFKLKQEPRKVEKKRPFSASTVNYSALRSKSIEFLSEEEISKAKLYISERTLETLLYMDFLKEKDKLKKDDCERDIELLGKQLSNSCHLKEEKEKRKNEIPPEMQVFSIAHMIRARKERPDSGMRKNNGNRIFAKGQEAVGVRGARNDEKRPARGNSANCAKRILLKADKEIIELKKERQEDVSMIWRSISGIDLKCKQDKTENAPVDEADIATGEISGIESREMKKAGNDGLNTEGDKIPDNRNLKLLPERKTRETLVDAVVSSDSEKTSGKRISGDNGTDTCLAKERSNKSRTHITFCKEEKKQRILRPTSAVIQRQLRSRSLKNITSASLQDPAGKARPESSPPLSTEARRSMLKRRQVSASQVRNKANENKKGLNTKVISSESLDLKPTNQQIFLTSKVEEKAIPKRPKSGEKINTQRKKVVPKRPISAPSRPLQRPGNVNGMDIIQEEQKISDECTKVLEACQKNGIIISIDTLRRALMPPCETAKPYSRQNLPHPSSLDS
ncbi:uncharacterized protein LOC135693722 isoform X2 [Rhopilema esculentum]|uniref:uncharacterized protein LOC135693722 isoform X2 n=1 Tax=Rhopilema esculentum TaxID=499914 RepID=UPI0031D371BC